MPRWPESRVLPCECAECGREFWRYKSHAKSERAYCSRACSGLSIGKSRQQAPECHPEREHVALGLCQPCYNRQWHLKNEGWSDHYQRLLDEQGGLCATCQRECATGSRLSVDHDHLTGAVRGLLCRTCNSGIGLLKDDPTIMRRAAKYIEDHS